MSAKVPPGKRTLLALTLAAGSSSADAAEQFGLHQKTVQRFLAKPAFHRLVTRLRSQMLEAALGRMADNMTRAANTFADLLDAPEAHIRLRAARALMSLGLRLRDSVELTDRLHAVEDELARKQEGS